ncbi:MAG: hypothetical protein ACQCN6_00335 [Candidatus Bathyarchaeia archaeon]|jgi:hypothetical protein
MKIDLNYRVEGVKIEEGLQVDKKSCIILFTLMLIITSIPVTVTSAQGSQLLDNLQVPSNGSHVTSNIALQNGVNYQIAVSGAYFTVEDDLTQSNQQDAMYGTHDKWTTHDSGSNGLYIDRWSVGSKQWGSYSSDHNYQCSLIGNGTKVSFYIYSSSYSGNDGSLTVQILGSPTAPSSPTPTTASPTPTGSTLTPSTSPTPTGESPSPNTSSTPTNPPNTSATPSSTNPQTTTASPDQTSGLPFDGPVTVVLAVGLSVVVVALVILVLGKRKRA